MSSLRFTRHASERALEMRVSEDAIAAVIADPEVSYRSSTDVGPVRVTKRGLLVVVWNPQTSEVVTVQWRDDTGRAWQRCPRCGFRMVESVGFTGRDVWHCEDCGLNRKRRIDAAAL